MKKQFAIALAAILTGGTLCASGALAAQEEQTARGYGATSGQPQQQQQQLGQQIGQPSEFKAVKNLSGMQIQNRQGEQLGSVDQVLVDMDQGRLAFVVVSGGDAATGENQFIVPWQMVKTSPQQDGLMLEVSSLDQLRPIAAGEQIEQTLTRQSGQEIFQFYGISPYWEESGQPQRQQDRMQQMPQDEMHRQMMEQMRQQRQQMPQTPQ